MERQRERPKEVAKETVEKRDKELETLRKELQRLRELKRKKESETQKEDVEQVKIEAPEVEQVETLEVTKTVMDDIESRLEEIDTFITKQLGKIDEGTYARDSQYVESQLQVLEEEIVGEKGLIEKEISPYEKLLNEYPWLEETRYEFMYSIPHKKKEKNDYESWKGEWAKVLYDYARYAILHVIYLSNLYNEKPFSNFSNRTEAIKTIAEELIDQDLAEWLSRKKDQLRIYWKTLDAWGNEIYHWAIENGKLEPILLFELREANEEFSNLPKEDIEEIFKILEKGDKGSIIKMDDGDLAFKAKFV